VALTLKVSAKKAIVQNHKLYFASLQLHYNDMRLSGYPRTGCQA